MKGREVFDNIPEEVCRELEAIVGPDYVTTDPNIRMSSYGFGYGHEIYWFQGVVQPPGAIVLPKTTEEVAGIVKVCNRHGITFHVVSSHTIIPSDPAFLPNVVVIDMKRMNKWQIDEKNMYAMVESGVIAAQMSAEANKRDLYYIMTGGGAPVGVLSNQFCFGWGHLCWRATPYPQRRLAGIEWVSPEGDIYRMNSFLAGDDSWFWGDGLGPDTTGLLYGVGAGWSGAMGIVTKVAFKLYPFQPEILEPQGMGGDSSVKFPPRVRYYNVTFPNKESLLNAIQEIGKADIASIVNIVPAFWRSMAKARGVHDLRNEFFDAWNPVTHEQVAQTNILRVLLIGRTSLQQLEYEERVLADIVSEGGGTIRTTKQSDEATFRYANTPDMWMMTGVFGATGAGVESTRCTKAENELFRDRLFANPNKLDYLDQKGELPWYLMWRRGADRYTELHIQPDGLSIDPEDPGFNPELTMNFVPWAISEEIALNIMTGCQSLFSGVTHTFAKESQSHHGFEVWNQRFKGEFDPKGVCSAVWPYAIDKIVEATPPAETEELKEVARKAEEGPWLGNPE